MQQSACRNRQILCNCSIFEIDAERFMNETWKVWRRAQVQVVFTFFVIFCLTFFNEEVHSKSHLNENDFELFYWSIFIWVRMSKFQRKFGIRPIDLNENLTERPAKRKTIVYIVLV